MPLKSKAIFALTEIICVGYQKKSQFHKTKFHKYEYL